MFESIVIRPNSTRGLPFNCGQMIENMFFYQETVVHVGRGEIKFLFDLADVEVIVELLKNPGLKVLYNNSHTGVGNNDGARFVDSFGLSSLDIEKELYEQSLEHGGDKKRSKRFAEKVSRLIGVYKLPQNFNQTLNQQVRDVEYRNRIVKATINHFQPELALDKIEYEIDFLDENNFRVHSNFDKVGVNPQLVSIDSPLLAIINASEDLQVAGETRSELLVPEYNSKILKIKVNSLVERSTKSQKEIDVFSHFIYDESWALSEAINRKQLHVKAVLPILRKANKYKEWLNELPADDNLLREYILKTEEKTVFERLPSKAVRFYLFNGIGAILAVVNPAIGVPVTLGLNAFDTFLLDKLGKKWGPNQFIENELRPLVKKRN